MKATRANWLLKNQLEEARLKKVSQLKDVSRQKEEARQLEGWPGARWNY